MKFNIYDTTRSLIGYDRFMLKNRDIVYHSRASSKKAEKS